MVPPKYKDFCVRLGPCRNIRPLQGHSFAKLVCKILKIGEYHLDISQFYLGNIQLYDAFRPTTCKRKYISLQILSVPRIKTKQWPLRNSKVQEKVSKLIFSEASPWSGILNPWIWLANSARSSGPDFPIRTPRTDRSEFSNIAAILAAFCYAKNLHEM